MDGLWVQLIGYLGSAFVILALAQRSILRLRFIGLAGSVTFFAYSLLIEAYPIAVVNVVAGGIHTYYLRRLIRTPEIVFATLEVGLDSRYLEAFLAFHGKDIARYQPEFRHELTENLTAVFILRDMVPAGLLIYRRDGEGCKIVLDYAIPQYRDFRLGRFVFSRKSGVFEPGTDLWSFASSADHAAYLERVGFTPGAEDRYHLTV